MTSVTVLGSTGSIGTNTLDVIRQNSRRFRVFALAAGRNTELLARQIIEFRPSVAVVSAPELLPILAETLASLQLPSPEWPELRAGPRGLVEISTAPESDVVVSAIVGVGGLEATYEAARAGKKIGLANKESLVSAGRLVMDAVRAHSAELLPIDSEHNGAHQCFRAGARAEVTKLVLTASGGPFRNTPRSAFSEITPAQALQHPTWKMGNRITIDSATLMNKSLEIIEARWLFGIEPERIRVLIHPQSVVHSMVSFRDGSVLAQLGRPDMRVPIQYALTWPEHVPGPVKAPDFAQLAALTFETPDSERFPSLRMAYAAARMGGVAPTVMNAANEMAVAAFLAGRSTFLDIFRTVEHALSQVVAGGQTTLGDIIAADADIRARLAR